MPTALISLPKPTSCGSSRRPFPAVERADRKASTMKELLALRTELMNFRVLDPACGSGNFLYVAYRELVRIEIALMAKLKDTSARQIRGAGKDHFAHQPEAILRDRPRILGVELAKVTLMLAKKLALDEAIEVLERDQIELPLHGERPCRSTISMKRSLRGRLFADGRKWTPSSATRRTRARTRCSRSSAGPMSTASASGSRRWPAVPITASIGSAKPTTTSSPASAPASSARTRSVRTTRGLAGLDYIVGNGGTITEAVSSMKWSGRSGRICFDRELDQGRAFRRESGCITQDGKRSVAGMEIQ